MEEKKMKGVMGRGGGRRKEEGRKEDGGGGGEEEEGVKGGVMGEGGGWEGAVSKVCQRYAGALKK